MEKLTILLVEDDLGLLDAMSETLEMVGYSTVRASNGREGLEALSQLRPDLIISDIVMPEMDGYAFHQEVVSRPELVTIPFIFLTGKSDQADVHRGLREGVDVYLTKPFDVDDLLVHVQNRLTRFAAVRRQLLRQLEELQNQVVTMFSHELRTPLAFIQGYTDLLAESPGSMPPDEVRLFLEGIQHGSCRLHRLVENLLALVYLDTEVSAREFERFSTKEAHLGRLVQTVVAGHERAAAARGLRLQAELDDAMPSVRIANDHIICALSHLLENAIKFTSGSDKTIMVRTYGSGGRAYIEIQDEGIGISANDMLVVFERFRQIDRGKQEQAGLGIGLAIARGLARINGGDIRVVSEPGRGSTFTLWLPSVAPSS
jgi:signal transduction histidine kinase